MIEDELEKPFGRPSGWRPELGKGKNLGLHAPSDIHSLLKEKAVKELLSRMALDSDFKVKVLGLIEKP